MKNGLLLTCAALLILLFSCKKWSDEPEPVQFSSEKELSEFRLVDSLNPGQLEETIVADIEDSVIRLNLADEIDATSLIATFSFKGKEVFVGSEKQESGVTSNDFTKPIIYTVRADDSSVLNYKVEITLLPGLLSTIPHIYIDTDGGAAIESKENYVEGNIRIEGNGLYDDYEGRTSIKGRGNSTWHYPKKPYKIKLDKKAPLLGLSPAKEWILLANYLDESLMCNAMAMKMGRLLRMPFTNHIIPVDVTVNGVFTGNYMFTEHKEVKENRINVGDNGVLLELDVNYDEAWQFKSSKYTLPVMIQYPELEKMPVADAEARFDRIRSDFEAFEQKIADPSFPENDYLDFFDAGAFVNYMIVYYLSANREINHPKSTYIYQTENGKYCMGPIWDFDWGFGYRTDLGGHFYSADYPLFEKPGVTGGTAFFTRFMQDPVIKQLFKEEWNKFKVLNYYKLLAYVNEYAEVIKDSYVRDHARWRSGQGNLDEDVQRLLAWFEARVAYIDQVVADF